MPRHTHPDSHRRRSRAELRAARERAIARRYRRAKRDGRLDHISLYPYPSRGSSRPSHHQEEAAATVDDFLQAEGYAALATAPPYARQDLHPDLLKRLPRELMCHVIGIGTGGLGQLADRDRLWRYCQGCAECKPYRYAPGWRVRIKNLVRADIEEGWLAWQDGEVYPLLRSNPAPDLKPRRGWC